MVYCKICLRNNKRRLRLNELKVDGPRWRTDPRGRRQRVYRVTCPDNECPNSRRILILNENQLFEWEVEAAKLFEQLKEDILKQSLRAKQTKIKREYLEGMDKDYFEDLAESEKKKLKDLYKEAEKKIKTKFFGEEAVKKEEKKEAEKKEREEKKRRKILKERAMEKQLIKCPYCKKYSIKRIQDPVTGQLFYRCVNAKCPGDPSLQAKLQQPNLTAAQQRAIKKEITQSKKKITPSLVERETFEEGETLWRGKRRKLALGKVPVVKKARRPFKFWGKRIPQAQAKREVYEKQMEELGEKYDKGELTQDGLEDEKKELKKKVFGRVEYKTKKAALKQQLANNTITKEEYKKQMRALKDEYRGTGKFFRGMTKMGKGRKSYAPQIMDVFFALALVIAGIIFSLFTGSYYFMLGFVSIAAYLVIPDPHYFKQSPGPFGMNPVRDAHSSLASLKSLMKISAIIMFALAFKSLGDLFNILFIATVFVGYYMLAIEYENHAEFLESLLRFVFLGAYFIPFVVFGSIFNSWVLVAIALAFFAIPPIPKPSVDLGKALTRGLSGATAYYEFFDKIFFVGLMLFALAGSGTLLPSLFGEAGWALTGTLKATFIWFWIVSLISGVFSPAEVRPMTGMLMLGGATVIYGVGPGSQEVGSALLGQWWPAVNEAVVEITTPIADVFGQLGTTFGNTFLLLTNPVGYATQILNGSYTSNPYGSTGAFGAELENLEVSPIFVGQPFLITTQIKNVGSHAAGNVHVNLQLGVEKSSLGPSSDVRVKGVPYQFPRVGYEKNLGGLDLSDVFFIPQLPKNKEFLKITDIGVYEDCLDEEVDVGDGKTAKAVDAGICIKKVANNLTPNDIRQVVFTSTGVPPEVVEPFDLRKKSLPIFVMITYNYEADSSLPIEFISQAEWDRLARNDELSLRKVIPSLSTSPVQFPIGTLEQPILAERANSDISGTPFYLGVKLESNEGPESLIERVFSVDIKYPKEFGDPRSCTPETGPSTSAGDMNVLVWTINTHESYLSAQGGKAFYCTFDPLDESALNGAPTRTYLVEAHAEYQFQKWETRLTKLEFGGFCAAKEDCLFGQDCVEGICVPEGTVLTPDEPDETVVVQMGDANYCEEKIKGSIHGVDNRECSLGGGGCKANECRTDLAFPINSTDTITQPLECRSISGVSVCCPSGAQEQQCQAAHEAWKENKSELEVQTAMWNAYNQSLN